jgi:hypothetical protein
VRASNQMSHTQEPPPTYVDLALERLCGEEIALLKLQTRLFKERLRVRNATIEEITDKANQLYAELKDCKETIHAGVQQGGGGGKRVRVGRHTGEAPSNPKPKGDVNHVRMSRILKEKLHIAHEELIPQTVDILLAHGITNWTEMVNFKPSISHLIEWGVHEIHATYIAKYSALVRAGRLNESNAFDLHVLRSRGDIHSEDRTHPRDW